MWLRKVLFSLISVIAVVAKMVMFEFTCLILPISKLNLNISSNKLYHTAFICLLFNSCLTKEVQGFRHRNPSSVIECYRFLTQGYKLITHLIQWCNFFFAGDIMAQFHNNYLLGFLVVLKVQRSFLFGRAFLLFLNLFSNSLFSRKKLKLGKIVLCRREIETKWNR